MLLTVDRPKSSTPPSPRTGLFWLIAATGWHGVIAAI
jgi:hypothetical protein